MNLKKISLVLAVCAAVSPALGATPEARGLAMGGAYSPFAKGAEGLWYNPATLGAITLAGVSVGVGADLNNNALTMMELQKLVSGSDADKYKSIDKIAKEGKWNANVDIDAGAGADVMGVGVGISQRAMVTGNDVTADTIEYSTFSTLDRPGVTRNVFDLNGTFQASSYREIGVGYGRELPIPVPMAKISAGAVVKIYQGTKYTLMSTTNHVDKLVPANNTGNNVFADGTTGKGVGFDLGAHAEFAVVDASLSIKNIASVISWDTKVQGGKVDPATLTMSQVNTTETIKQTLPMAIALGVGGHVPVVGTSVGMEIESVGKGTSKGDSDSIETSGAETRLRIGAEQSVFGVLNFRAGYVTGGKGQVTLGLGLGALIARLDVGVGIGLDAKSGSAGLSGSVSF